jgi:hypothetical protein
MFYHDGKKFSQSNNTTATNKNNVNKKNSTYVRLIPVNNINSNNKNINNSNTNLNSNTNKTNLDNNNNKSNDINTNSNNNINFLTNKSNNINNKTRLSMFSYEFLPLPANLSSSNKIIRRDSLNTPTKYFDKASQLDTNNKIAASKNNQISNFNRLSHESLSPKMFLSYAKKNNVLLSNAVTGNSAAAAAAAAATMINSNKINFSFNTLNTIASSKRQAKTFNRSVSSNSNVAPGGVINSGAYKNNSYYYYKSNDNLNKLNNKNHISLFKKTNNSNGSESPSDTGSTSGSNSGSETSGNRSRSTSSNNDSGSMSSEDDSNVGSHSMTSSSSLSSDDEIKNRKKINPSDNSQKKFLRHSANLRSSARYSFCQPKSWQCIKPCTNNNSNNNLSNIDNNINNNTFAANTNTTPISMNSQKLNLYSSSLLNINQRQSQLLIKENYESNIKNANSVKSSPIKCMAGNSFRTSAVQIKFSPARSLKNEMTTDSLNSPQSSANSNDPNEDTGSGGINTNVISNLKHRNTIHTAKISSNDSLDKFDKNLSDNSLKKTSLRKSSLLYHDSGIDADESLFNSKDSSKKPNSSYSGGSNHESIKSNLAKRPSFNNAQNSENNNQNSQFQYVSPPEISLKSIPTKEDDVFNQKINQKLCNYQTKTIDRNKKSNNNNTKSFDTEDLTVNKVSNTVGPSSFKTNANLKKDEPSSLEDLLIETKKKLETNHSIRDNLKNNSKADFTPHLDKEMFAKSNLTTRKSICRRQSQSPKRHLANANIDSFDDETCRSNREKSLNSKKLHDHNSALASSFSSMKNFHIKSEHMRSHSNVRSTCNSRINLNDQVYSKSVHLNLPPNSSHKSEQIIKIFFFHESNLYINSKLDYSRNSFILKSLVSPNSNRKIYDLTSV